MQKVWITCKHNPAMQMYIYIYIHIYIYIIYVYILHINIHEIYMLNKVKRQTIILKHNMSTKLKVSNLEAMRH